MDNELRTYEDIVGFVGGLPGSSTKKGAMPDALGGPVTTTKRTYELERALSAEEALHVFLKYKIAVHDRKRLILSILNIQQPE